MKISILGTGRVGGALGIGWTRAGHEVVFGTRDPYSSEVQQVLLQSAGRARAVSVADSVAVTDVTALAIPWSAAPVLLQEIAPALAGKTLIDCTNGARNGVAGSGAEQVAHLVPSAKVVKAFNTTGFENMQNPKFGAEAATMFYAGDDADAKRLVHLLAADLGFDPVDAGALSQAGILENLGAFWVALANGQKMGRGIAFRLLRRSG